MRKKAVLLVVTLLLLIPCMARADSYLFSTLLKDTTTNIFPSVTVGDKVFSDFDIEFINPASVTVDLFNVGDVYFARFTGSFNALNGADNDYAIFYSVAATGGNKIYSIGQSFNFTGSGLGGSVFIGETVFDGPDGNNVAQSSISHFGVAPPFDFNDPPGELINGDNLDVNPALVKLWVTKDINVIANQDGYASATIITQSFHQTTQVPEPATLLLLGFGLIGLAGIRRKFKSSKS